jgi:hypothetical protein
MADTEAMNIHGIVQNGVVVLEKGATLPEGTRVFVAAEPAACAQGTLVKTPGHLPIVRGGVPGSVMLTNARIYEMLDAEDLES